MSRFGWKSTLTLSCVEPSGSFDASMRRVMPSPIDVDAEDTNFKGCRTLGVVDREQFVQGCVAALMRSFSISMPFPPIEIGEGPRSSGAR